MARRNIPADRVTKDSTELKLYSLADLSLILGISREGLLVYVKSGDLKAKKIAGKWRVRPCDVDEFLAGEFAK